MCAGIFRRACVVLHPDHKQDLDLVLGEATALKESLIDKLISLKDSHAPNLQTVPSRLQLGYLLCCYYLLAVSMTTSMIVQTCTN